MKDIIVVTGGARVRTFFYGGHPYTFVPRHFLICYYFIIRNN